METGGQYAFGPFCLDAGERALRRGGEIVNLPPKAVDLLAALVTAEGRIVSKEELLARVWPGTFVEENNLSVNISAIRKVLAEAPGGEGFIETIPRRGYRFAGPLVVPAVLTERTRATLEVVEQTGLSRRSWLAVAGTAAATAGVFAVMRKPGRAPEIDSLAVLPFKGAAAGDELGFGIADSAIARLANAPGLRVIPTQSVHRFDVPGADPLAAGRQLGVAAVLDGTVRRSNGRTRLNAQLIRVPDGKHLWARTFDHASEDLFALEDALAAALSDALSARLKGLPAPPRRTSDAEAHRLHQLARYHFFRGFRGRDSMRKTIEYTSQSIARDPNFADPWVFQCGAYIQMAVTGSMEPRQAMLEAKTAALRAVQLAPDLASAHAALSGVQIYGDFDLAAGKRSFEQALRLDPNNDIALIHESDYYLITGRLDESAAVRKKLQEMVPLEPLWVADVAHPLYYSGRYEEALVWTRKALDMDPAFPMANTDLVTILRLAGKHREAVEAFLDWRQRIKADPAESDELRTAFAGGGIHSFDRKRLENALGRIRQGKPAPALSTALLHLAVGDRDKAAEWLEKGFEQRVPQVMMIGTYPPWKPLRGHAKFEKIRTQLGLP